MNTGPNLALVANTEEELPRILSIYLAVFKAFHVQYCSVILSGSWATATFIPLIWVGDQDEAACRLMSSWRR